MSWESQSTEVQGAKKLTGLIVSIEFRDQLFTNLIDQDIKEGNKTAVIGKRLRRRQAQFAQQLPFPFGFHCEHG